MIDADSIIYNRASALEVELPSEEESQDGLPEYISLYVNPDEVLAAFWTDINGLRKQYRADEVFVAITDSGKNYRLGIDPNYKGNRAHARKPLAVRTVRDHLKKDDDVYFRPTLEADDVIGILMTMKTYRDDERICWSPDKDMRTITGWHCGPDHPEPVYVWPEEADQMHLIQTVAGDSVDGIPGLPGVGPVSGRKWLEKQGWTWESALALADSKGFDEDYLLTQARLTRILRRQDYNFKLKQPRLWTPDNLKTDL
jgi:DNA polymerase-1